MTGPAVHTEAAFETAIEAAMLGQGWSQGNPADYDRDHAVVSADLFAFIRDSQPTLWQQLESVHGAGLEFALLKALAKERKLKGSLHVLRRGFKFYGKRIPLAYFKPAHGLNPDILAKYAANRLTATRQIRMVPASREQSSSRPTWCCS